MQIQMVDLEMRSSVVLKGLKKWQKFLRASSVSIWALMRVQCLVHDPGRVGYS